MTLFNDETREATSLAKLDIWRCGDGCGFHVRAGSVVLSLSDDELAAFLKAAGGIYLGENCAHVETTSAPADNPHLTSELEH